MISIRKSEQRGKADFGWLTSRHSFSFGQYYDPQHMGFGPLRVINEDWVDAGKGFGAHPHENMEIISYVLDGALEHKDSIGNGSVISPGDVQRMTAGTGITHSEFNHSSSEKVHFLQIWILPEKTGLQPGYEQKNFAFAEPRDDLTLIGSHDGRDGSVKIHQDVDLYATTLEKGAEVSYQARPDRKIWLQVVRGSLSINGQSLNQGDGAAIEQEKALTFAANDNVEFLLFDMA